MGWTAHLLPSQRSASVTTTPERLVKSPTAVQEDELGQEIPASWPVRVKRFRVGTIDHPGPGGVSGSIRETRAAVWPPGPLALATPTARASSTTAAAAATVAWRIRPRIATPAFQTDTAGGAGDRG
jgi:hypothetical protein